MDVVLLCNVENDCVRNIHAPSAPPVTTSNIKELARAGKRLESYIKDEIVLSRNAGNASNNIIIENWRHR